MYVFGKTWGYVSALGINIMCVFTKGYPKVAKYKNKQQQQYNKALECTTCMHSIKSELETQILWKHCIDIAVQGHQESMRTNYSCIVYVLFPIF